MKLPNGENAEIPLSKLVDYLLSLTHPVGKWKARVFQKYGFHAGNVDLLRNGLLAIAKSEDIEERIRSQHGIKYIIDGTLRGPLKAAIDVRTIWIVETGKDVPRFVTAYPHHGTHLGGLR